MPQQLRRGACPAREGWRSVLRRLARSARCRLRPPLRLHPPRPPPRLQGHPAQGGGGRAPRPCASRRAWRRAGGASTLASCDPSRLQPAGEGMTRPRVLSPTQTRGGWGGRAGEWRWRRRWGWGCQERPPTPPRPLPPRWRPARRCRGWGGRCPATQARARGGRGRAAGRGAGAGVRAGWRRQRRRHRHHAPPHTQRRRRRRRWPARQTRSVAGGPTPDRAPRRCAARVGARGGRSHRPPRRARSTRPRPPSPPPPRDRRRGTGPGR